MTLKTLTRVAAACATMALTATAFAVPQFTIDASKLPGVSGFGTTTATSAQGSSTELLTVSTNTTGPQTITGSGYVQLTGFTNDNTVGALNANNTGLNFSTLGSFVGYGLYLTFNLTATVAQGQFGVPGSTNTLQSLTFTLWADPGTTDKFTPANAATNTAASVTDNGSKDIALGQGTFLSGSAGIDGQGGAFLNSIEQFAICTGAGTGTIGGVAITAASPNAALVSTCTNTASAATSAFFAAPIPFYTLGFDAFNNTSQGVTRNGNTISVQSATGVVDFNNVPEPGTLALVGAAIAGLGLARRNRKA